MTPALEAGALETLRAEIESGRRVGLAVSGGSDSAALLELAADALPSERLSIATVDHGLRAEAREEARAVARRCETIGATHETLTWTRDGRGGNLMARARTARYALLADWAAARGIGVVALGHTRDDVAETLLLGLARSAGLDGLGTMRAAFASGGVVFLRPLLDVGRDALRDMLVERGLSWCDDPSNEDDRFDRVRVRRALSVLDECGITARRLAHSASHLAKDRASIRAFLRDWAEHHVIQECGALVIGRAALEALPHGFARRIVGHGLRWVSNATYPPRGAAIERLMASGAGTLAGCILESDATSFMIGREPAAAARAPAAAIGAPWDGRWRIVGPDIPGGHVSALGIDGLCLLSPEHRRTRPRHVQAAGPALWRHGALIAAPLAGLGVHRAEPAGNRDDFAASLLSY